MARIFSEVADKDSHHRCLDYSQYVEAFHAQSLQPAMADHYSVDISIIETLASDPDQGGKATISSCIETMVALELQRDGILGVTIHRGHKQTDLLDGWGRKWDVKAPPSLDDRSFDQVIAVRSVVRKFENFPAGDLGILLCVSFMNSSDYRLFQSVLELSLTQNQKFLVRAVHVDGVF